MPAKLSLFTSDSVRRSTDTGITDPGYNRNQVSMLLLNTRRIFLDSFAVLDYGKPPARRFQDPDL